MIDPELERYEVSKRLERTPTFVEQEEQDRCCKCGEVIPIFSRTMYICTDCLLKRN